MVISLFSLSPSPLLLGAGPGRGRIRVKRHIICGRYKNKASAFQVGDVQLLALLLAFLWGHQKSSCWGPWPAALSDWLAHWFLEMGTLLSTNSQFASWKKKRTFISPQVFSLWGDSQLPLLLQKRCADCSQTSALFPLRLGKGSFSQFLAFGLSRHDSSITAFFIKLPHWFPWIPFSFDLGEVAVEI